MGGYFEGDAKTDGRGGGPDGRAFELAEHGVLVNRYERALADGWDGYSIGSQFAVGTSDWVMALLMCCFYRCGKN